MKRRGDHLFDVHLILGDAYRKLGRYAEAQVAYDLAEQVWNETLEMLVGEPRFATMPLTNYELEERRGTTRY